MAPLTFYNQDPSITYRGSWLFNWLHPLLEFIIFSFHGRKSFLVPKTQFRMYKSSGTEKRQLSVDWNKECCCQVPLPEKCTSLENIAAVLQSTTPGNPSPDWPSIYDIGWIACKEQILFSCRISLPSSEPSVSPGPHRLVCTPYWAVWK